MEPGGVLHIDERGIVGDGVVAVTPHPDFRYIYMDIYLHPLLLLYLDNVHTYVPMHTYVAVLFYFSEYFY